MDLPKSWKVWASLSNVRTRGHTKAKFSTIHWEAQGYYNYCPRDVLLVIGDHIIETPNVIRSRARKRSALAHLLQ